MAGLIKSQILKHLSKFAKNLSSDKIHLSTLKGEGELTNLELDENVLMELMELPTWLSLSKAVCNKVSIRIPWTKLKKHPICLFLDKVVVEMETCDDPRVPHNTDTGYTSYSSGGKYGFIDRCIDNMCVSINDVTVNFKSHTFHASIQLSRIKIESKTPLWKVSPDVRNCRVKDIDRGMLLLFKEVSWQTLRVEANAIATKADEGMSTPLRLIANQSRIRITLNKRLSDCCILSSRLQLILDDLLWVLTESQLKAAILFAQSLQDIISKSAQLSKMTAGDKIQMSSSSSLQAPVSPSVVVTSSSKANAQISKLYDHFAVKETSYHLYCDKIDLHLCDEVSKTDDSPKNKRRIKGGATQITLKKLLVDHYPFHISGSSKSHWIKHNAYMETREAWVKELLAEFQERLHLVRSHQSKGSGSTGGPRIPELMESCFVIRVEDFAVYQVSTPENRKSTPPTLLTSNKKTLFLPQDMSSVHVELTSYYYPEDNSIPVPDNNMYVMVNPIKLVLDYTTLLWANQFALSLFTAAAIGEEIEEQPPEHFDIKIEALMPQIVLPAEKEVVGQNERPNAIQIQSSKCIVTNTRVEAKSNRSSLNESAVTINESKLYKDQNQFPNEANDLEMMPSMFQQHANSETLEPYLYIYNSHQHMCNGDVEGLPMQKQQQTNNLQLNSLRRDANCDVWCLSADHVCLEYLGIHHAKHRPVPFLEAIPVKIWIGYPILYNHSSSTSRKGSNSSDTSHRRTHDTPKQFYKVDDTNAKACDTASHVQSSCDRKLADCHILIDIQSKVSLQLDHYQYLFLMRLIEGFTKFNLDLEADTKLMTDKKAHVVRTVTSLVIPEIDLAIVAPPIPDSHSLPEMLSDKLDTDFSEISSLPSKDVSPQTPADPSSQSQTGNTTSQLIEPKFIGINVINTDDDTPEDEQPLAPEDEIQIDSDGKVYLVSNSQKTEFIQSKDRRSPSPNIKHQYSKATSDIIQDKVNATADVIDSPKEKRKSSKDKISAKKTSFSLSISNKFDKMKQTLSKKDSDVSEISDDFDTMSLSSNLSSDDDFVILNPDLTEGPEQSPFDQDSIGHNSVQSSQMTDVESASITSSIPDSVPFMVSVTVYTLYNAEIVVQVVDENVKCKIQVDGVTPNNLGNSNLDDFRYKFAIASNKPTRPVIKSPPIKVLYMLGPNAELRAPSGGERGYLHMKARGHDVELAMSSLNSLLALIEDEVIGEGMPIRVEVDNFNVQLQNDLPAVNPSSASPQPLKLHLDHVLITQGQDDILHVTTQKTSADKELIETGDLARMVKKAFYQPVNISSNEETTDISACNGARDENVQLKELITGLIAELATVKTDNSVLAEKLEVALATKSELLAKVAEAQEGLAQTKSELLAKVAEAQEGLAQLSTERDSLLATLNYLQQEMLRQDSNSTK